MTDRTETEFDEVIYDDEATALVLFHRKRCPVCDAVLPVLEQLEQEYVAKVAFFGMDVEESGIFNRFSLMGVPQVLIFEKGNLVKKISGQRSYAEFKDEIEAILK